MDEVIEATGRREERNRLLPAHLTVYDVLAMTLFSSAGHEEVMRSLTEGLRWACDGAEEYELPSQVAISKARARLGPEPLAELFDRACLPLATSATRGAYYRDWRLVSIDGTTIDVADTGANAGVFGRDRIGRGHGSAFPQLRIVALGECGTHAVLAAAMDSYAVGEVTLAKQLVAALQPGMLCLADRGFTAGAAAPPAPARIRRAVSHPRSRSPPCTRRRGSHRVTARRKGLACDIVSTPSSLTREACGVDSTGVTEVLKGQAQRETPKSPAGSVHQCVRRNPAAASSAATPSGRNFEETSVRTPSPASKTTPMSRSAMFTS